MPKAGVLSVSPYSVLEDMNLKKLFLMYDKLVIDTTSLEIARMVVDPIPSDIFLTLTEEQQRRQLKVYGDLLNLQSNGQYDENFRNINYLRNIGFIELRDYNQLTHNNEKIPIQYESAIEEIDRNFEESTGNLNIIEMLPDAKARIMSLMLGHTQEYRTIPILRNSPSKLNLSREAQVVDILIEHFPQPDDSVSWEQLVDFKTDPDTLASYYNLGDWINETCRKEYTRHEIIDKFNHLYHQYLHQYRIHKLKYKTGILEMLITGTIDAIAGNFGQAISTTLFSLSKAHTNLLEAESKFAGREIAYIHKANSKFGN